MAVRTQQAEVLQPVIETVSIGVMQRQGERSTAPLGQPAALATRFLDAGREQPGLEVATAAVSARVLPTFVGTIVRAGSSPCSKRLRW